jgi:hypothetical protein
MYSKTDYGKDRQRMNLDQYRAIHTIAPHRAPTRRVRAGGREHWTQLMANNFTEQFRTLRDQTGLFDDKSKEQRLTFHEIHSLGSWLYEKAGYSQGYVQALMAYSDEKMTAYYQAEHEQKWMTVAAELSLKSILYK